MKTLGLNSDWLASARKCALVALLGWWVTPALLHAQTVLYWDINGVTAGASAGTQAAGTWDQNTTANWTTSVSGILAPRNWNAGTNKIATFSAGTNASGSFTVTTNGTISDVGGISFEEGDVTLGGAGTLTLTNAATIAVAPSTATISAILTGSVGLTKTGAGTLTLSGANTYTGATNINAGVLRVQSAGALGTVANTGNTTVAAGAALQMLNGITTTNGGTLVLNGTGGGAGALQSVGATNTWNSSITLGSDATIFSATAGNILYLNADYVSAHTLTMGSHTLTVDGPGDTWANANVGVAGDTGGLIKNGTGTFTLYGYNTFYTGATAVNAGTLELVVGAFTPGWHGINGPLTIGVGSSNPALAGTVNVNIWNASHAGGGSYADQISSNSAVTINSDGALNVGTSTTLGSLTLNGGQVNVTSGQTITPSGSITSNANSAHQTSLISGGAISLPATATITVARDPTLASDLTITSQLTGTGSLTKTGAGILTLAGSTANTFSGTTTVSGGTLALNKTAGTNAIAGNLVINSGSVQLLQNNQIADASAVTVASGAGLNLNSYAETIGALSGSGVVTLGSGTLTVGSGNASSTFSGSFAGGDTGTLVKSGTGTLTFGAGMNLATGTLQLAGGTVALGSFSSTFGSLSVTADSILDFGNSVASTLSILNSVTVASGVTLTIRNWIDTVDFFYSQFDPGATNRGRIVFTGYTGPDTRWQAFDHQITPVPEPSVYGAALMGFCALLVAWRSRRRPV